MKKNWLWPTIGALFIYGVWGFLPKLATRSLKPESAIVFEVLGALAFCILLTACGKANLEGVELGGAVWSLLAGFTMMAGGFFYLVACKNGPVSLVVTISGMYPVITVLLARLIGERLSWKQWVALGLIPLVVWLLFQSPKEAPSG